MILRQATLKRLGRFDLPRLAFQYTGLTKSLHFETSGTKFTTALCQWFFFITRSMQLIETRWL